MPSELEDALGRFRRSLLTQERAAASEMVRIYGGIWQRLRPMVEAAQAGLVTDANIYTATFAQDIRAQVEAQLRRFAALAEQSAIGTQQMAIDAALRNVPVTVEMAGGSVGAGFNRLNARAVENLVGFASDGSPLRALFEEIAPTCAGRVVDTLARGIALGQSPRVTAKQLRAAFGTGLTRALTIARTETLRAYRETTHEIYRANDHILDGWFWVAALTRRTCPACWAMHGSFHPLTERLDDHPNGRCSAAPSVRGRASRITQTGKQAFAALPEVQQRGILGPAMFAAWQDGAVHLWPDGPGSIVGRREDVRWGTMRYALSLSAIVGPEAAKMYREAAR